MNNPLVSIMMPVYNGLPYIKASLESLYRQSYSNWECIVVNDGSTDGTALFLNSLTDKRIRIFHFNENKGRSAARQKALDEACGKYLAMLDADDIYHPEKLKKQVDILENSEYVLVSSAMISFGLNTNIITKRGIGHDCAVQYNGTNTPVHASSMFRTVIAKNNSYATTLNYGEDQDFLRKYLYGYKEYFYMTTPLYYYSEFDSVTKKKILESYINRFKHNISKHNAKQSILLLFKIISFALVSPFVSINQILKRRGYSPNTHEIQDFEELIKPIILFVEGNM